MRTVTGRLTLDEHVASVVEFMERNLPADRLEYVAMRLPALARVIWTIDRSATVEYLPLNRATQSDANEFGPAASCVGGGSVAAAGEDALK